MISFIHKHGVMVEFCTVLVVSVLGFGLIVTTAFCTPGEIQIVRTIISDVTRLCGDAKGAIVIPGKDGHEPIVLCARPEEAESVGNRMLQRRAETAMEAGIDASVETGY